MRHAHTLAILLLSLLIPSRALGAPPPPVAPGDRIRIDAPPIVWAPRIGRLTALTADTLTFQPSEYGVAPIAIPIERLRDFEVSRGRRNGARTGGLIGLVIGGALGLAVAADMNDSASGFMSGPGAALTLGACGFLLGASLGGLSRSDRWETVDPARLRPDGAALPATGTVRWAAAVHF